MDRHLKIPTLPGPIRKNDALFLWGACRPMPFVYAYCQETTEVVHGPACKVAQEVRPDRCGHDRVAVFARRGGGGTVVLSKGMVVLVVVDKRRKDEGVKPIFARIHKAVIALLHPLVGAPVREDGLSDLVIDNKKILGSSLYLSNRPPLLFYQSSLMVESDISVLTRYLNHPPREPGYRAGRAHEEFCTTLREAGCTATAEDVCRVLNGELQSLL